MTVRRYVALIVTLVLAVPAGSAWTLSGFSDSLVESSEVERPLGWAWTFGLAPGAAGIASEPVAAVACALGDINGDGLFDLVLQVQDATSGLSQLTALAAPDFVDILWTQASAATRILQCAADLDLDGTLDPVLRTAAETVATGAGGVAEQSTHLILQTLSGASGAAMVGRIAQDAALGAANGVGGATAQAGQAASAALLPAAAGAQAFVQTTVKQAQFLTTLAEQLPLGSLTSTVEASAHVEILSASGAVVASLDIGKVGENALALATIPLAGQLPNIAVLTQQAVSPVQELAGAIPKLAMFNADGTLAWAISLAPSTGLALLVPRAGDLNLDGVQDLIVETIQQGVETVPASAFQVISGLDGSQLFSSGAAVSGLVAALPLGQLAGGPALLMVEQATGTATMTLSALDGAGSTVWSIALDATAKPVNQALDAYTGDITGFTDLTGDAIADVAVLIENGTGKILQAIDGASGQIAWAAEFADVRQIVPLATNQVEGLVSQATAGGSAALVVVSTALAPTFTFVDAATGLVQWTATAATQFANSVDIEVQAAGDIDGDGVPDILATLRVGGTDAQPAADGNTASAQSGGSSDASVVVLSGATGETLWSEATAPDATSPVFTSEPGPAFQSAPEPADPEPSKESPALGTSLGMIALLLVAWVRRKQR